mmetsp:Transcript_76124/g.174380  ORF Transcript_76124/g.174380 Transcript_76124/m.174380 type:complete len:87 (+) Transcript_76124:413-673(+)
MAWCPELCTWLLQSRAPEECMKLEDIFGPCVTCRTPVRTEYARGFAGGDDSPARSRAPRYEEAGIVSISRGAELDRVTASVPACIF